MNGQLSWGAGSFPRVVKICRWFGQVSSLFLLFSPTNHPAAIQFINKHNSTLPVASSGCQGLYLCPCGAAVPGGDAAPFAHSWQHCLGLGRVGELLGTAQNWGFTLGSVVPQAGVSQGHWSGATNPGARWELVLGSPLQVKMEEKKSIILGASVGCWLGLGTPPQVKKGLSTLCEALADC